MRDYCSAGGDIGEWGAVNRQERALIGAITDSKLFITANGGDGKWWVEIRAPRETALSLHNAIISLRERVAKDRYAAAPRTEPPPEFLHIQHHWLSSERATNPCMSEWVGGEWHSAGEVNPITPEEMNRRGWDYDKPCKY